jgi:hypothetical protein
MTSLFEKFRKLFSKKGDISIEMIIWMAIGFILLFILVSIIIASRGKGVGLICYVKNIFGTFAC